MNCCRSGLIRKQSPYCEQETGMQYPAAMQDKCGKLQSAKNQYYNLLSNNFGQVQRCPTHLCYTYLFCISICSIFIGSTPIFRLTRPFTASKWALALTGSFCKSSKTHLHKSVQHEKSDSIIVCDSTMVVGRAKYNLVQLFNFCRTKLQKL